MSGSASEPSGAPASGTSPSERAHSLTRWAMRAIPGTLVGVVVAAVVGRILMSATGTPDGALLTSSGAAGWASWFAVLILMIASPLAGAVLALRARRAGGAPGTSLALGVNTALTLAIVATSVVNLFA